MMKLDPDARRNKGDGGAVAVIGLWHLGTVTAACLASYGRKVIGVDPNPETVANLRKGVIPVYEPGLAELVKEQQAKGMLSFTTDFGSAVKRSDYVVMGFDTPVRSDDSPDLSPIFSSLSKAMPHMRDGSLLVVSSQVPVGTCDMMRVLIKKRRPRLDFGIACVPENLKLGDAVARFRSPDFLVIGADSKRDLASAKQLYSFAAAPLVEVDLKTAEMVKHAINSFLACEVSFANELGNLCDKLGVDSFRVADALHLDPRIGKYARLNSGLGFAGGTLARDVNVLRTLGREEKVKTSLLDAVVRVNRDQNLMVAKRLKLIFGRISGLRIGALGLTYKPGTSAIRRSVAIEIINELARKGAVVKAYDPKADISKLSTAAAFKRCASADAVADSSDAVLLLTGWPEFKELDFKKLKARMAHPVIVDAVNMLNGDELAASGFLYLGIGRGNKMPSLKGRSA